MNEKWEELKALLEQDEANLTDFGQQTIETLLKELESPISQLSDG
ncbi:hypothetical protein [Bacillus solimangrovi]|nr:hypothetical protein [Bacillus solimangrovi]